MITIYGLLNAMRGSTASPPGKTGCILRVPNPTEKRAYPFSSPRSIRCPNATPNILPFLPTHSQCKGTNKRIRLYPEKAQQKKPLHIPPPSKRGLVTSSHPSPSPPSPSVYSSPSPSSTASPPRPPPLHSPAHGPCNSGSGSG